LFFIKKSIIKGIVCDEGSALLRLLGQLGVDKDLSNKTTTVNFDDESDGIEKLITNDEESNSIGKKIDFSLKDVDEEIKDLEVEILSEKIKVKNKISSSKDFSNSSLDDLDTELEDADIYKIDEVGPRKTSILKELSINMGI